MKFVEEHDGYLRSVNAPFLSDLLFTIWLDMLRAGRTADRKRVGEYLRLRNVPVARKIAAKLARKVFAKVGMKSGGKDAAFCV